MGIVQNIVDLPDEIIVNIFKYLPYKDLTAARLVCNRFYEISVQSCLIQNEVLVINEETIEETIILILMNSRRYFKTIKFVKIIFTSELIILLERYYNAIVNLILVKCDIDSIDFHLILSSTKNLVSLTISSCRSLLMNLSFNIADMIPRLDKLKYLNLSKCSYLTDSVFAKIMLMFPNVLSLKINNNEICFHSGLCKRFYKNVDDYIDKPSNLILTIFYIIQTVKERSKRIKCLDISSTNINYNTLHALLNVDNLKLNKLNMYNCYQLSPSNVLELGTWQPFIIDLDLCNCKAINDEVLKNVCANMTKLRCLNIENCPVTNSGLAYMTHLKQLEDLNVSLCDLITSHGLLASLNQNGSLRVLKTRNLKFDNSSLQNCVACLKNLRHLDLYDCFSISDVDLNIIFNTCRKMLHFTLTSCKTASDEGFIYVGSNAASNEVLAYNKSDISSGFRNEVIKKACLDNLQGLMSLNLQTCTNLTDRTFYFGLNLQDLRVLNLANVSITPTTLFCIGSKCSRIENLNLSNTQINDESIFFVINKLKRLEFLYVTNCIRLTNQTITSIMQYEHSFKELDVMGCYLMTAAVINLLEASNLVYKLYRTTEPLSRHSIIFIPPPPKYPINF